MDRMNLISDGRMSPNIASADHPLCQGGINKILDLMPFSVPIQSINAVPILQTILRLQGNMVQV